MVETTRILAARHLSPGVVAPLGPLPAEGGSPPPASLFPTPVCTTPSGEGACAPLRDTGKTPRMDALTAFGLFAVTFMLICYVLEDRAPFWTLLFALGCLMGSAYGFLQGAWPFGAVELIWFVVALRRWIRLRRTAEPGA